MGKQSEGCWKQGKWGVSRAVEGEGQAQTQHSQRKMTLTFNEAAAGVRWGTEGLCLWGCKFNRQIKPWNLWPCLSPTNRDNRESFTEALKRSKKNVFSASEGGLSRRGTAALVLTSLEASQFASCLMLHRGDHCQFLPRLTQPGHNSSGYISNQGKETGPPPGLTLCPRPRSLWHCS